MENAIAGPDAVSDGVAKALLARLLASKDD